MDEGAPLRAIPYLLGSRQLAPADYDVRAKLALAFLSIGQPGEARKESVAILQKDPRNSAAALMFADTTANQEELTASEQLLRQLPEQNSAGLLEARASLALRTNSLVTAQRYLEQAQAADPKRYSVHLGLAALAFAKKNAAQTEQELKTAVALAPTRSAARIKYADFKLKSGAEKEAKVLLEETTRLAPDYLPAWQMQAQIATTAKDYATAQTKLNAIFAVDADNLEARLLEADNLLVQGQTKKAVEAARHLDLVYKDIPFIKYHLARAYLQDDNRSQAVAALSQATSAAPEYTDAVLLLSQLNLTGGEAQAAVTALTGLLKKHPGLLNARLLLSNAYLAANRPDEAETELNNLLIDAPKDPDVYLSLSGLHRQQNKLDAAAADLAKAREVAPDNLDILFQSVDLDLQQKDDEGAFKLVRAQLQRTPDSAPVHFLEARIYTEQKDWDHAEAALLKTLELDPKFSSAYDLLISSYVSTNKLTPALGQLNGLLAKNPNNPRALMMSALIYAQKKDTVKAREYYEKVIAADPNFLAALNNLAYLDAETFNELDKASDLVNRARNLASGDASVADTLGWISYKRGDYSQALRFLQESASKLPSEPEVQYHFALANYMMGQTDAARAAFKRAADSTQDFVGKADIPARLAALGTGDSTGKSVPLAELEAAVKQNPRDPVALLRLGEAQERKEAWNPAAAAYQQALGVNARLLPALDHLARLYAGPLHDPAKALGLADTAHALAPNDLQLNALLARLTFLNGNDVRAYSLLRDSARDLPDDLVVRRDFALSAYHLGRIDEARQGMGGIVGAAGADDGLKQEAGRFLSLTAPAPTLQALTALEPEAQKALQTDPTYLPALMVRSLVQAQRGEIKPAEATYSAILQKTPDFLPAQRQLAALYLLDKDTTGQAYDLAVKVRKAQPDDPDVAAILAEANYDRKEYAYSLQLWQEVVRQRPLTAKQLYYQGQCLLQTDKQAQGQETLTRALAAGLPEPLQGEAQRALAASKAHK